MLSHPSSKDQSYRDEVCAGSILYPYIYLWISQISDENTVQEFSERLREFIPNCSHQAWFPDDDTDNLIWCGERFHGICLNDLSPQNKYDELAELLNHAIEKCPAISEISAIRLGLTPMFLTACKHYRLPIPPHFWFVGP